MSARWWLSRRPPRPPIPRRKCALVLMSLLACHATSPHTNAIEEPTNLHFDIKHGNMTTRLRPPSAAAAASAVAGLGCGRPPSAAAAASHLPPGDIRSFFCASDHQFSRHRRQRRRTRRCESDSPLVADATSTSPPARSSPQLLPPATGPSSLSTATTSLYDANAQIAPPSIREPSNGSDTHNSEHEGRGLEQPGQTPRTQCRNHPAMQWRHATSGG